MAWNEYYETEPGWDFVEVQARAGGDTNWSVVSTPRSGLSGGWTNRTADLSRFAGMSGVEVRFLFSANNDINNHFPGWYVDDVRIYEGTTIEGWVRDINGRPIVGAQVFAIGRGGVTNAIHGHRYNLPGKVFGSAFTADDGSYSISGLPQGRYYVKAAEVGHVDEFYNGALFTAPYAFGSGLNPGVPNRDHVGAAGWINLTAAGASQVCHFELERGSGRGYLGILLSNPAGLQFETLVNSVPAFLWNGQTNVSAAMIAYLTRTNTTLANIYPDWETNAVAPVMLADLAPGNHQVYAGTSLVYYAPAEVAVREGEVTRVNLYTNQGEGRLYVSAANGSNYAIWIAGRDTGLQTPALIPVKAGWHQVTLVPAGAHAWIAPKRVSVHLGRRASALFSVQDVTGNPGSLEIRTRDVNGNDVTGATVYVDGRVLTVDDVAPGSSEKTPAVADKLKPGTHYVTVAMNGYALSALRPVAVSQGFKSETIFVLREADTDYDRVGDSIEVSGYTNIYAYSRNDDPDGDGLSNLFEFDLFRLFNVPMDIFNPDSDGDGMQDGDEVGYDGDASRFAVSVIETNAVQGTPSVRALFVGRYLDGIDYFGAGPVAAAIEGDRFEASTVTHPNLPMPNRASAVTVFSGIPATIRDRCVSWGHNTGVEILADAMPERVDTDGDGMWDGFEFLYGRTTAAQLDPIEYALADEDADFDGFSNYLEFLGSDSIANTSDWTDPTSPDTDGDGMPDGWEYTYGLDPRSAADAGEDPDDDGLTNDQEFYLRQTNPRLRDTDADGLPDGAEVLQYGSNPHAQDTDADGLLDGREVWDRDLDGVFDGGFFNFPSNHVAGNLDGDAFADGPMDWDTDGDGMPDGFEVIDAFGNIRDPALNPFDDTDADEDFDGDGLTNYEEYRVQDALVGQHPGLFDPAFADAVWDYPTDPFDADSDDDGMPDGWEVMLGLHPLDPIPTGPDTSYVRYDDLGVDGDLDGDGLFNLREFTVRFRLDSGADSNSIVGASTDPWNADTDEDGLGDGEEDRAFRASPVLQDTDLDGLADGALMPDKWSEVESSPRLASGDPAVTNHFDQALNDLWRLVWPRSQDLPHWEPITVDVNSPLPAPRWGVGATYVPVFETKAAGSDEIILLDNRQLVVIGGRDGVQRFTNVWEYVIRSNTWNLSTSTLGDIGLDDGLSELSAVLLLGYHNTKRDGCPCGSADDQPYPCVGTDFGLPKARPWDNGYQRSSFDWTYVLGGWDTLHQYHFANREMPSWYYKSTDSPDPVTETMTVASEGYNNIQLTSQDSLLIPFGTPGAGTMSLLSLTNFYEGYNDTNAVNGLNPIGANSSNGFYFSGVNLDPAQHLVASAFLRFRLTGGPVVHNLSLRGELFMNGQSSPDYNSPTISQRLFGWYVSAPTNFSASVNGPTIVDVDVTPIIQDMMAQPNWAADSAGFILYGTGSGASVFLHSTELHISYSTPFGSFNRLGYFFNHTYLRTNCEDILRAELEFDLRSTGPSTNYMNILGELWSGGGSHPSYNNPTISNRLAFGEFRTSITSFTAVVNGLTTTSIDITPIMMEILEYSNWGASNMGFIVYGGSEGSQAYYMRAATRLRVTYRPFYKIDSYWQRGEAWLVSSEMPSRRKSIVQVYDYKRDRVVAYGGLDGRRVFGDTYEGTPAWVNPDGTVVYENPEVVGRPYLMCWRRAATAQSPGPRWGHSMVYDPVNERVLLFGGFDADHKPLNDLWAYEGEAPSSCPLDPVEGTWTKIADFTDTQKPQARGGASLVFFGGYHYDRGEDAYCMYNDKPRLVLFGGTDGISYFNDTWVYDHVDKRWILVNPVGEQSQGPSPRAFAAMVFAQNARWVPDPDGDMTYLDQEDVDRCATPTALLFGGRIGTLPTSDDTDGDLVPDGLEYALGGPAAGRDPRINKLVHTNHPTETIPFSYLRIGSVPLPPTQRGTVANLEALNYSEGDTVSDYAREPFNLPFQGYPLESPPITNNNYATGVDALLPEQTALWYHRDGGEDPFGEGDVWELGVPDTSVIGTNTGPSYAYSGRWCFGTDVNGRYPNNIIAELYSPMFSLVLPPENATSSNFVGSFFLVFREWLKLADSNDTAWVQVVRPDSPAAVATRGKGSVPIRPTVTLLGPRNNAYNSGGAWRLAVLPLDPVANESNLFVRFYLQSDSGGRDGGWFIDDVAILQGGALSGILTNAGHSPLPGVMVSLFGENPFDVPVSTTITKSDGSFRFGGLLSTGLPLALGNYYYGSISSIYGPFILSDSNSVVEGGATNVGDLVLADISLGVPTEITWPTVPGITYQIEYAETMFGPWHVLGVVTASGISETYFDYIGTDATRFYRVIVLATE
ncbi:MAG: hypothetical protein JXB04_07560 [Kiritimatiellae bacterium]|nr:hypothetical protein [Kiritimatiellia bacterium]